MDTMTSKGSPREAALFQWGWLKYGGGGGGFNGFGHYQNDHHPHHHHHHQSLLLASLFFSCLVCGQLKRWPCHSLSEWVSHLLILEHMTRLVTFETYDLSNEKTWHKTIFWQQKLITILTICLTKIQFFTLLTIFFSSILTMLTMIMIILEN